MKIKCVLEEEFVGVSCMGSSQLSGGGACWKFPSPAEFKEFFLVCWEPNHIAVLLTISRPVILPLNLLLAAEPQLHFVCVSIGAVVGYQVHILRMQPVLAPRRLVAPRGIHDALLYWVLSSFFDHTQNV